MALSSVSYNFASNTTFVRIKCYYLAHNIGFLNLGSGLISFIGSTTQSSLIQFLSQFGDLFIANATSSSNKIIFIWACPSSLSVVRSGCTWLRVPSIKLRAGCFGVETNSSVKNNKVCLSLNTAFYVGSIPIPHAKFCKCLVVCYFP